MDIRVRKEEREKMNPFNPLNSLFPYQRGLGVDNGDVVIGSGGTGRGLCGGRSLLQVSLQVEGGGGQVAGSTGTEFHTLDVGRSRELTFAFSTAPVLDADGEDGKVGNLHVLALQQQFLDTVHHVGEHASDGSLGEWCVVVRHVLGQSFERHGLFDDGVGKILTVGGGFRIGVLA